MPAGCVTKATESESTVRTLDLFSGAGGLSIGLTAAGFDILGCVELKRDAAETYSRHHPECLLLNTDVRTVDFSVFKGKVDVVVGGPPCQPFSLGGQRKGSNDSRDMIPEFLRCLETVRPETFIMENVPGLTMKGAAPYFAEVLRKFEALGYLLNYDVLNASEYGVPQSRRRLIVLGSLDRVLNLPEPTHGDELLPKIVTADLINLKRPLGEPPNCPVKFARFPDLRPSPYAGQVYNGGGRPLNPAAPSPTLLASAGGYKTHWVDTMGVAPEYHAHLKNGGSPREGEVPGARRLTIEESILLQTFPPEMTFAGRRSSQYAQIGDAVPPMLAAAVGRSVLEQVGGKSTAGSKRPRKRVHQESLFA